MKKRILGAAMALIGTSLWPHVAHSDSSADTSGRDRYQTANVWDAQAGPSQRLGAATLSRSRHHISGRIMTNVPTAGDAYTLWVVVFNNPSACVDGCNDEDLANPAVRAIVYNASGAISAANMNGGGVINLDFEIESGFLARDRFVLFPVDAEKGLRRGAGYRAEVHLVVDQHPPIVPGADSWIADLTQTNFPGTGPVTSVAVGVFAPCPERSCPASVL